MFKHIIRKTVVAFLLMTTFAATAKSETTLTNQEEQVACLAQNIYFEAKGESVLGQMAVAFVTMNRVLSDKYPNTVCEVVKQGYVSRWHLNNTGKVVPLRNKCQFSWWCDGKPDRIRNQEIYNGLIQLARVFVKNYHAMRDITHGSLWYHADYVSPSWKSHMRKTVKIGRHIFYAERTNSRG